MEAQTNIDFFTLNPSILPIYKFADKIRQEYTKGTLNLGMLDIDDSINYSIKIKGDKWDGSHIDVRMAQYVIDLQKQINEILLEAGVASDTILVKVKIEQGCAEFWLNLKEFLLELVKDMTPKQKFAIVTMVLVGICVYLTYGQISSAYWNHQKEALNIERDIQMRKMENEDKKSERESIQAILRRNEEIRTAVEIAMDRQSDAETPVRNLIKKMAENDKISNIGSPEVTKEVALAITKITRKSRSSFSNKYFDGKWRILNIDLDEKTINLGREAFPELRKLSLEKLSASDILKIFKAFESKVDDISSVEMDFQITAKVNAYTAKDYEIVGIAPARENSITPDEIPSPFNGSNTSEE